jgi:hypothetical protein
MAYISCVYAPPPAIEGDPQMVVCIDENGVEWHLTEDSQVGDWLRYKEQGGTVREAGTATPAEGCD